MNTGEVVPDVMTPITWSLVEPIVGVLLGKLFKDSGLDITGLPLAGRIAGRAYFNLNTLTACARKVPGMGDEGLTRALGGQQGSAPRIADRDLPLVRVSPLRMVGGTVISIGKMMAFSPAKVERMLVKMKEYTDTFTSLDPSPLTPDDLASRITAFVKSLDDSGEPFALVVIAQMYAGWLFQLCRKNFGNEGDSLANRMLSGLGNNAAANAGLELWRLAKLAKENPSVESVVSQAENIHEVRKRLAGMEAGDVFLQAWDRFMKRYGHHTRAELELMNPRWSETPDYILSQVRSYLLASDENDFEERYRKTVRDSAQTVTELGRSLKNPFIRRQFRYFAGNARRCAGMRETYRSELVRQWALLRRMLLELGNRLTGKGILNDRDDIFFLRAGEIQDVTEGRIDAASARERIAARRAEYEANLKITPPPIVVGRFDPELSTDGLLPSADGVLKGLAVSPGVVTGPARVILRHGDDTVLPGEILVAPFTDPGWTPYFLNAAAIVMDLGGLMSHGSIIAREFGIPAVVNVGSATKVIETGQMIQVDGVRGVVRVLQV
jgi:pyruvate,water dikinase